MFRKGKKNNQGGFTLIELMIVVAILGLLAYVLVPRIMERPEEARRIRAQVDIKTIESALKLYKVDTGTYPTTEQGLSALIRKPDQDPVPKNWREGGYLEGTAIKDPWGNPFEYVSPGSNGEDYEIISYGYDGKQGGTGRDADVSSSDATKE